MTKDYNQGSVDQESAEIARLLRVAGHGAPPLANDPVAAMLGLVPDSSCQLDSRQFQNARKRAGVRPSDIARRLRQRGWEVSTSEASHWERNEHAAALLPPAVVQAVAAVLEVEVSSLVRAETAESVSSRFAAVKQDDRFRALAARWANAQRISIEAAVAALDSRMVATVHRGDEPDIEQTLASLDALVRSVEQSQIK